MLIGKYLIVLPHGDGDALVIENKAYLYSYSNDLDYFLIFSQGHNFLAYLFSFVYSVFGREDLVLGLIMVFLGTLLIKYIHDASYLIWKNNNLATNVAWVAVFFPQLCLHSALLLREIPISLCLILSIISFIKYLKTSNAIYIFRFLFFTIFGILFHSAIIFVFVGILIYYVFRKRKFSFIKKTGIVLFFTSIVFFLDSQGLLGKFGSMNESLNNFTLRESRVDLGGSAYPSWMMMTGSFFEIWKVPVRFVTFLFAPLFPFLVRTSVHIFGLIDSFFYFFIFFKFYKYRKLLKTNETHKLILTICLTLTLIFSLGVSNVGTAIRHRTKYLPLLLILIPQKKQLVHLYNNKVK